MTAATSPTDTISVRLRSITYAARETHLYEFSSLDGEFLPDITAGSHVDLHLPNGVNRSYSLVRSGKKLNSYIVGVKLDPKSRGGSRYIHERLMAGTVMTISTPRNHFPLKEDASHTVLIAGGIGITPVWCMAQRLQEIGASWELWYSCRSRKDASFLDEMSAFKEKVHLHFDDEAQRLLDLNSIVESAHSDAHLYCCGPAPMLAAYETAATACQRAPETVHLEHFGATQSAATDGGYVIELARSGKEFTVAQGQSILDVLNSNKVEISFSCQQGTCGACEVAVLSGEVDHRDAILTPSERASNSTMMVCCSGAKSARLVLDI